LTEPPGPRRTAWVSEDTDFTERGFCGLGTFSASVQGPDVPDPWPWISSVSIDEALVWARARAPRVIVRYVAPESGPAAFTAGDEAARTNLKGDGPIVDLPPWPPAGLDLTPGRNPGWEFMERTDSDPPIQWDVKVTLRAPDDELDPDALVAALRTHPDLTLVEWYANDCYGDAFRALITVWAATRGSAAAAVVDAGTAAVAEVLPALGPPFSRQQLRARWSREAAAFPSGSEVARWNADVRPES
jgi:hypothetical protein